MSEELALEQVPRRDGTIMGYQGATAQCRVSVDRGRDQFLTGSRFAGNEDVDIAASSQADEVANLYDAAALAYDVADAYVRLPRSLVGSQGLVDGC